MGTIDTPEKFEEKRFAMASRVWREMKANDSKECRNCHDYDSMDFDMQSERSMTRHEDAADEGLTCIDCHKGVAHSLPEEYDPEKDIAGESPYYQ
jgi:cytochrome c-type protein NapC